MLSGIFPSTCNSSGGKADIPVSTDLSLRVAKGHCQSVPGCKTSCGDAQPFKGFCLEPPEQPEPLSTDEDQWGWNLFWFRHSFLSCSDCPGWNTKPSYHLFASRRVYPVYLLLAFPNSFYLCSCAVQESSCQHNIHYYSDKNGVAFTSISQRQHYSLLQNSIKNRRSKVNCHLAAESQNCLPLLQIDQVWSRGGNGVWSFFVMGQSGKQTSCCSISTKVIRSGTKEIGMIVFPASSIGGDWIWWATGSGGIHPPPPPPGSGFSGHKISCKVVQKHRKLQPQLPK